MARPVKVLLIGDTWWLNFVADTPGGGQADDPVNGTKTRLAENLALDPNRTYDLVDAAINGGDIPYFLRDAEREVAGQILWDVLIQPQLPVDLALFLGGNITPSSFFAGSAGAATRGADLGLSAIVLTLELLESGANCVMPIPLGAPTAFTAPVHGLGDFGFLATQDKLGEQLLAIPDLLPPDGKDIYTTRGPDLRAVLSPFADFYETTPAGPGDYYTVPNNDGALAAGNAIGEAIKLIPTYMLQPDQDGT